MAIMHTHVGVCVDRDENGLDTNVTDVIFVFIFLVKFDSNTDNINHVE
jgi:hypothetical protein